MIRLTLRTLLAYADDLLDAPQAREIGIKLVDSPKAQDLLEKIHSLSKQRQASFIGGEKSQPNPHIIAAYLDNTLPPDEVQKLEQEALENDDILREIAVSHQVLCQVISQPPILEEQSYRKLYRLLPAPAAIAYRKPKFHELAVTQQPSISKDSTNDSGNSKLRPLLIFGLISLTTLLVLSMSLAIPGKKKEQRVQRIVIKPIEIAQSSPLQKPPAIPPIVPANVIEKPELPPVVPAPKKVPDVIENGPPPRELAQKQQPVNKWGVANEAREAIGTFSSPREPLLFKSPKWDELQRLNDTAAVESRDLWLALPGMKPEILLNQNLKLILAPDYPDSNQTQMLHTSVVASVPPAGVDADLQIHCGRIYLQNNAATSSTVRLRFLNEIWDVSLAPGAKLGMVLISKFPEEVPFQIALENSKPRTEVTLKVETGIIKLESKNGASIELPAESFANWNNGTEKVAIGGKEEKFAAGAALFPASLEPANKTTQAVAEFFKKMLLDADHRLGYEFVAVLKDEKRTSILRSMATYYLPGTEMLPALIDAMSDGDSEIRRAAIRATQLWLELSPDHENTFVDTLIRTKGFPDEQARFAAMLLRPIELSKASPLICSKYFDVLNHERLMFRSIVHNQLSIIDSLGLRETQYTPDSIPDRLALTTQRWKNSYFRRNPSQRP
ncbi:MAG: hypothetical protein R3B84_09730 [Zavarzinella sp.]